MNRRVLMASTAAVLAAQAFGFPSPVGEGGQVVMASAPLHVLSFIPPKDTPMVRPPLMLKVPGSGENTLEKELIAEAHMHASSATGVRTVALKSPAPVPAEHAKVQAYIDAVAGKLDKKIHSAMKWIDGTGRRLLALKYYIRRNGQVRTSWAWSPKEIVRYKKTAEYRDALVEVAKVKAKFAELNPGYTLKVNTEIRILEEQIAIWNETPSVTAAGNNLLTACLKQIADTSFADEPDKEDLARFRRLLESHKVSHVPTAAVPGFSQHGQLRAFDFVIQQGDQIIATTEAASIGSVWEKSGWTTKLQQAIMQASSKFEGPLAAPREPWHYTYIP